MLFRSVLKDGRIRQINIVFNRFNAVGAFQIFKGIHAHLHNRRRHGHLDIRFTVQEENVVVKLRGLLLRITLGIVKARQYIQTDDVIVDIRIAIFVVANCEAHICQIVQTAPSEEDGVVSAFPINLTAAVGAIDIDRKHTVITENIIEDCDLTLVPIHIHCVIRTIHEGAVLDGQVAVTARSRCRVNAITIGAGEFVCGLVVRSGKNNKKTWDVPMFL